MKKHLIAAAVAAAVAVPAMAQVTISGRVDASLGRATNDTDTRATKVNSSLLTTSQLVISGSEDLGGGLKANMVVASQLAPDTGTFSWGNRGFLVGISGAFGAVNIGKDTGLAIDQIATSATVNNLGNYSVINNRLGNTISYTTPSVQGFSGRVVYSAGNDDDFVTVDADDKSNKQTELSLAYSSGPVLVRFASSSNKRVSQFETDDSVGVFGTDAAARAADSRSVDKVRDSGVMANYNFGMALVNLRYVERKVTGTSTVSSGVPHFEDQKVTGFGLSIPVGNGVALNGDYLRVNTDTDKNDLDVVSITAVKDLSKRTNVYAAYSQRDIEDPTKTDETIMAFGIRHAF